MATSFQTVGTYAVGPSPASVATADLSGTGNQDIIVSDESGSVDVLMNRGDGSFAPAVNLHTAQNASGLAIADLGNGEPDIITADPAGDVDVLMNQGNGSFGAAASFAAGFDPVAVTTADLSGIGGAQDLIVADYGGGVNVLRNLGNGSFLPPVSYAAGTHPRAVTTDTLATGAQAVIVLDQGVGGSGSVDVLTSTGTGGLNPAVSYAAGYAPFALTTADLGNGRQDIVIAGLGGTVSVLMQNPDGSFASPVSYDTIGQPLTVTTGDLTGDGRQDIVVGEDAQGGEDVLMNNGDGSFAPAIHISAGSNIRAITTAHLAVASPAQIVAVNGNGTVYDIAAQNGPTITAQAPATVEQNQTTILGTVTPAQSGDTLSVSASPGALGTILLQAGTDGNENVIYTAPASIVASGIDAVSYTVTDTTAATSSTSGTVDVTLDAGPTNSFGAPQTAEQGQTVRVATVTPGEPSDVLTLSSSSSIDDGTLALVQDGGVYDVNYTAPGDVSASTTDDISYTVKDQLGGITSGNAGVTLDGGPAVASVQPSTVEAGHQTTIGMVTLGEAGDVPTLTQTAGALGTLALVQDGSVYDVVYTASNTVTQDAVDNVAYQIVDQHGTRPATGSASVQLDAGPAATTTNPGLVEAGQQRQIGTATPGLPGDVLTLNQVAGPGTVSLGQAQNGVQVINYTAPANVVESRPVTVQYSITDGNGGVVNESETINLDRGPRISGGSEVEREQGQTETIGYATPGVAGDTLSIAQTSGQYGTVALGTPQDDGPVPIIYTAPAHVIASGLDTVGYTITDGNGGSVSRSTAVFLDVGPSIAAVPPHTVEQAQQTQIGIVTPGAAGDVLTLTQAFGSRGTLSLVSQGGTDAVIYTAPQAATQSFTDALAYTVADQNHDVVARGTGSVTVDGGPQVSLGTPGTIEQSQTTVLGTVSPGETGDVLSVSQDPGALGTVTLGAVEDGSQQIVYTAPATVSASAADTLTYHIVDQYNDTTATRTATVQLDDGPQLAASTPGVVEKSQTTVLGVVTPGIAGDILSVSQAAGALGAVTLEADTDAAAPAGAEKLVYTAPGTISASAADAITYTLTDQHDGVNQQPGASVTQGASVQLDAGPSIATATPGVVEQTQTTVLGTVTPGLNGDTLSLTQTGGSLGTVTLGPVGSDGTQQIIYAAPANVPSSTTDTVGYTITDQYDDVVASQPATVILDAGPALATATPDAVEQGQTTILGTVRPGETGDTLTLTQGTGGVGTVTLGAVQADGTQQVIYTAPASVSSNLLDSVSYSIADQHDQVVAASSASVVLDRGPKLVATTPATVEQDQTTVLGSVKAGMLGDTLSVTQAPGALGTVTLRPAGDSGIQQVIYTAPADVAATGTDVIAYSITDQHDDVVASRTAYVTLDAGPQLVAVTPDAVEQG